MKNHRGDRGSLPAEPPTPEFELENQEPWCTHATAQGDHRITDLIALALIVSAVLALVLVGNAGAAVITAAAGFVVGIYQVFLKK
ncbi:hypothetical protein ACQPZ2_30775 [Nocardia pseudovaccinii]|uniref:hypothetical protein n=1 Tax=Nocardia pseudovaccinii TaxID=189540 RepID=UPI003D94199D